MGNIIKTVYELPIMFYWFFIIITVTIWLVLALIINNKTWGKINIFAFVIWVNIIVLITLFFRNSKEREVILIPFYSFYVAQIHYDVYNEIVLNILLFVPVGLAGSFILNDRVKKPFVFTTTLAFAFSLFIEAMQFVMMMGISEIDDVIFNTLGAIIGTLPNFIYKIILKYKRKELNEK